MRFDYDLQLRPQFSQDINVIANRGFKMLSANVPAASGFGVAFLLGLNYG